MTNTDKRKVELDKLNAEVELINIQINSKNSKQRELIVNKLRNEFTKLGLILSAKDQEIFSTFIKGDVLFQDLVKQIEGRISF